MNGIINGNVFFDFYFWEVRGIQCLSVVYRFKIMSDVIFNKLKMVIKLTYEIAIIL